MSLNEAIALHPKDGASARCAVCHDVGGELVACPSCQSLTHADCRANVGGCATLGCRERPAVVERPVLEDERPPWIWAVISSWLVAMVILGALEAVRLLVGDTRAEVVVAPWRIVAFFAQTIGVPLVFSWGWRRGAASLARLLALQVVLVPLLALAVVGAEAIPALIGIPLASALLVIEPALAAWFIGGASLRPRLAVAKKTNG